VVRSRDVVAEGGRALPPDEDAPGSREAGGEHLGVSRHDLQMFGSELLCKGGGLGRVGYSDQREGSVVDARALRGECLGTRADLIEDSGLHGRHDEEAVGTVLGLRAEIECRELDVCLLAGDQHQL
jgi:hypothetical protein